MEKREKWEMIGIFRRYAAVNGYGRRMCTEEEEDAVDAVMDLLTAGERAAVRNVYMYAPKEKITVKKIRGRVLRTASEMYYSEATVYRMLRRARELLRNEMETKRPPVL